MTSATVAAANQTRKRMRVMVQLVFGYWKKLRMRGQNITALFFSFLNTLFTMYSAARMAFLVPAKRKCGHTAT